MRTIKLSKNLTRDVKDMCQHYIEQYDGRVTPTLSQDYEELRDICLHDQRFRLTVTLEERIPHCADIIVNILVKHILDIVDCNEDDEDELTAFYVYLEEVHGMPVTPCIQAREMSTIESLEFGVRWLINEMGGDA